MEQIFTAGFCVIMLALAGRAFSNFLSVREHGLAHTEELLRKHVTLGTLWKGDVADMREDSLIPTREGLLMEADEKGLKIRGTRTVSKSVF